MRGREEQLSELIDRLASATRTGSAKWNKAGRGVFHLARNSGTVILESTPATLGHHLLFLDRDGEVIFQQSDGQAGDLESWTRAVKPGAVRSLYQLVEEATDAPSPVIDDFLNEL